MQMQSSQAGRLAELAARMAQATAKAAEARAELKKAERRSERADEAVSALREEYDRERLRLWGDQPDVAALLESEGSMCLYHAGQALAEAYGLGFGMQWGDTKQIVLHVRLNRGEAGALARAAAAVRYFAPFVKPKAGMRRFGVQHRESGDFGLELRYSTKTGLARVGRLHFGQEDETHPFESLEQALRHIEAHHWIEDILDMPAEQQLLLANAG
jgi:hypothetical protein